MTCERALHACYRRNRTRRNRTRGSDEGVQACGVHLAASQCLVEQQQPYLEIDMEGLQVGARACWNYRYVFGESGAALPVW